MRLVLVVWEDCSTADVEGAWELKEYAKPIPPKVISQVGYVYSQTENEIEITCAVDSEDKMIARRDRIPRGMVRSIVDLAPAQAPAKRRRK
jgi:hypothetical protein